MVQNFKEMIGMHMIALKDKINYKIQRLKIHLVRQHVLAFKMLLNKEMRIEFLEFLLLDQIFKDILNKVLLTQT